MPAYDSTALALAAVVTRSCLTEFHILYRSFELLHGRGYRWFLRCDDESAATLSKYSGVHTRIFARAVGNPTMCQPKEFRAVMAEKFAALEDALEHGPWQAIIFLDSDLVITAPFLDHAMSLGGDVVLTPHYFPPWLSANTALFGTYNAGFVLIRSSAFLAWWRGAFELQTERFFDQGLLDDVPAKFTVRCLSDRANIGHWRRPNAWTMPIIPPDCLFLHLHLFKKPQPDSENELAQKTFALQCLDFLRASRVPEHRALHDEIIRLDETSYYGAIVNRRVAVVTRSEPVRAVRALMMARTLPRQVPLYCLVAGRISAFEARVQEYKQPSNLLLMEGPENGIGPMVPHDLPADWLLLVDIDYVFPQGFLYQMWDTLTRLRSERTVISASAFADAEGRYVKGGAVPEILATETAESHMVPLTRWEAHTSEGLSLICPITNCTTEERRMPTLAERSDESISLPGAVLVSKTVWNDRGRGKFQFTVARETFIFHLWHPSTLESATAGWAWRELSGDLK